MQTITIICLTCGYRASCHTGKLSHGLYVKVMKHFVFKYMFFMFVCILLPYVFFVYKELNKMNVGEVVTVYIVIFCKCLYRGWLPKINLSWENLLMLNVRPLSPVSLTTADNQCRLKTCRKTWRSVLTLHHHSSLAAPFCSPEAVSHRAQHRSSHNTAYHLVEHIHTISTASLKQIQSKNKQ